MSCIFFVSFTPALADPGPRTVISKTRAGYVTETLPLDSFRLDTMAAAGYDVR